MLLMWLIQLRTKNAAIVDIAWTFLVGAGGLAACYFASGDIARRQLTAVLIALWALRLDAHLIARFWGEPEEGRYQAMRKAWGPATNLRMLAFYQYQALSVPLFVWSVALAAANPAPLFQVTDGLALVIWLVGVSGVSLADWQLTRFKATAAQRGLKGTTCRDGLWRYSRHPNYFFEWVHWWTFLLLAWGGPWFWLAAGTPLVLLYFLLFVTGIPPTEAQGIVSRGDDYRDYQRTTSPFVPWFPRSSA
ncbi:hypothetical protein ETAA8_04890 [Anatilimnocola aggregata]|uniref:Uncharacterized protein n=2 Tax=Anatilimnocola aggregata TaxID=2528021 RepID=A0A517Y599_9BACT|nr:hypothetical protein ETAA8_04890 [Anatilimnocola aggregata]